jgi:hypothetical protein
VPKDMVASLCVCVHVPWNLSSAKLNNAWFSLTLTAHCSLLSGRSHANNFSRSLALAVCLPPRTNSLQQLPISTHDERTPNRSGPIVILSQLVTSVRVFGWKGLNAAAPSRCRFFSPSNSPLWPSFSSKVGRCQK